MRTDRGWRRFYATGWLVSAVVGAVGFVQWQAHMREVERRAEEAERTRDEVARRRAVEERLRIARELHDSLTHSISVIKVQAGVAAHLARKNGEEPSDALLAIQEASSDAVRELRSTLDVLRRRGGRQRQRAGPAPGARGAGAVLRAADDLTVLGDRRPLPPDGRPGGVPRRPGGADQRHPARRGRRPRRCRSTYDARTLTVRVDDDGAGSQRPPVPGYGLIGMRERVTALGGRLRARARRDRRVHGVSPSCR